MPPPRLPSPYMKQPVVEREQVTSKGKGVFKNITFALSSIQGWRMGQEDAHCHLFPSKNNPNVAFVGVFDGHAGERASAYVADSILRFIENSNSYKFIDRENPQADVIGRCVMEGFFDCDEQLRQQNGFKEGTEVSGCTGVVCVVTEKYLVVGNAGDSRCVIVRGNSDIFSTRDHKPDDEREKDRVAHAGGKVVFGRINGDLASARSFGDFRYKQDGSLPPSQQLVTVMPDIALLDNHEENQLMILACDGIWDVMSNLECSNFILAALSLGSSVQHAADMVLEECLRKGSGDNMSIIIVTLKAAPKPKNNKPSLIEIRRLMQSMVL